MLCGKCCNKLIKNVESVWRRIISPKKNNKLFPEQPKPCQCLITFSSQQALSQSPYQNKGIYEKKKKKKQISSPGLTSTLSNPYFPARTEWLRPVNIFSHRKCTRWLNVTITETFSLGFNYKQQAAGAFELWKLETTSSWAKFKKSAGL